MNWLHTIRNRFEHRALVLMYHRVADVTIDPWNLAVSPQYFDEQIDLLTSKYNVIPVTELIKNLQHRKVTSNTVCVTFDDGYTDNYLFAKPILEKYNCPATFFIPSHYIGQRQPFWWEALQILFLETPQLPQLFQMPIPDDGFEFDMGDAAVLTTEDLQKHKAWRWPEHAPTQRCELYFKIWETLRPLPLPEIEMALAEIQAWAGFQPEYSEALQPMRPDQLSAMAENKLFHIGLHTTTHPALAYHEEDVQYWELAENKKYLQPYHPINVVAFPYGNYNNSTLAVLQRQRIDAGFTTEAKKITTDSKLHCLGRFQVLNQNAADFEKELQTGLNA